MNAIDKNWETPVAAPQIDTCWVDSVSRGTEEGRRLAILSDCAQALVAARDEIELLTEICRVIVNRAEYAFAWVGYVQDLGDGDCLSPIAAAGGSPDLINNLSNFWRDGRKDGSPAREVLDCGHVVVRSDLAADRLEFDWKCVVEPHGIKSALAVPLQVDGKMLGVLSVDSVRPTTFSELEIGLLEELSKTLSYGIANLRGRFARTAAEREMAKRGEMLAKTFAATINSIARAVFARDPYTGGHENRVGWISWQIGKLLDLDEDRIEGLRLGASIHDLGKLSIPTEILSKPSRLLPMEFELIKTHPGLGADIVREIDFPWPVYSMIKHHHERLDGSGYPEGRKGDDICLEARIIAVADVVELMGSHRPYRPALGLDRALAEINKGRERSFDPKVVDACGRLISDPKFVADWQKQAGIWAPN